MGLNLSMAKPESLQCIWVSRFSLILSAIVLKPPLMQFRPLPHQSTVYHYTLGHLEGLACMGGGRNWQPSQEGIPEVVYGLFRQQHGGDKADIQSHPKHIYEEVSLH